MWLTKKASKLAKLILIASEHDLLEYIKLSEIYKEIDNEVNKKMNKDK